MFNHTDNMQLPYNTTTRTLRRLSQLLGIKDYQARSRRELFELLKERANTDPEAYRLLSKQLNLLPDEHPNRYNYVALTDPHFTEKYQYRSLTPEDITHIQSLQGLTRFNCQIPNHPVFLRNDLVVYISQRLNDPLYNIKYFNASVWLFANKVKHKPLTIDVPSKARFLLPQKETFVIIDMILSDPDFRKRSMKWYEKRSKHGRELKLGTSYIRSYITHTYTYNVGEFFREIGFKKAKFFFTIYLKRCQEKELMIAYLNLCALWRSYLSGNLHIQNVRLEKNREYAEILYPELC